MIACMKFLAMAEGIVSLLAHIAGRAIRDPSVYDRHAAGRGYGVRFASPPKR